MHPRPSFHLFLAAAVLFSAAASLAHAQNLSADFSTQPEGNYAPTPAVVAWTGMMNSPNRGSFKIAKAPAGGETAGTALVFEACGVEASPTAGTIFTIKTPDYGAGAKTGSCLYHFLIPAYGDGETLFHYGGVWNANATDLILKKGTVYVNSNKTNTSIGSYATDKWNDLRVDFDFAAKTFSISLNGNKIANAFPWNDTSIKVLGSMSITGNRLAVAAGTPILYLQKYSITSTAP